MAKRAAPFKPVRNLKEWLRREGWTQRDLARALGVVDSHASSIVKRGEKLTLARAAQIQRLTGLSVHQLTKDAALLGQ